MGLLLFYLIGVVLQYAFIKLVNKYMNADIPELHAVIISITWISAMLVVIAIIMRITEFITGKKFFD